MWICSSTMTTLSVSWLVSGMTGLLSYEVIATVDSLMVWSGEPAGCKLFNLYGSIPFYTCGVDTALSIALPVLINSSSDIVRSASPLVSSLRDLHFCITCDFISADGLAKSHVAPNLRNRYTN